MTEAMTKERGSIVEAVAKEYGVHPEDLWRLYNWTMASNFEQDLRSIAKKNSDELKKWA